MQAQASFPVDIDYAIRGAVVNNNNFEVSKFLLNKAIQAVRDYTLTISGYDNNRNFWRSWCFRL
jgi:hypothetical protein